MENIVFLEGIRGKRAFPDVPINTSTPQAIEHTVVIERKRLRSEYLQNSTTSGVSSFLRAMIDFSVCSHSGNGFVQLGFAAPHFPKKMQIGGHHHAGTQMHARREIYFIREVVGH